MSILCIFVSESILRQKKLSHNQISGILDLTQLPKHSKLKEIAVSNYSCMFLKQTQKKERINTKTTNIDG